jgi:hypothetical protein
VPRPPSATIDVPAVDVIELLDATSASGVQVAASVIGAIAGVALLAFVIGVLGGVRPDRWRMLATFAMISALLSATELVLLIADGAALDDRRVVAVATRLLLLLAGAAVITVRSVGDGSTTVHGTGTSPSAGRRPQARASLDPLVASLLVLGALTVPLAAPDGGGGQGLALATARSTIVAVLVAAVLWVLDRRANTAGATIIGSVLVVGMVVGIISAPDRVPAHRELRVVIDDTVIDLTVVPARPGANELHLYAWDRDGDPRALDRTEVRVSAAPNGDEDAGLAVAHELFVVSPNHHLSYTLDLPTSRRGWELELTVDTSDGDRLTATTELEAS